MKLIGLDNLVQEKNKVSNKPTVSTGPSPRFIPTIQGLIQATLIPPAPPVSFHCPKQLLTCTVYKCFSFPLKHQNVTSFPFVSRLILLTIPQKRKKALFDSGLKSAGSVTADPLCSTQLVAFLPPAQHGRQDWARMLPFYLIFERTSQH